MLDDTKKLCLLSGDIIHMQATMSMVFEPMDLRAASPATVSRCGMVYLEPDKLGHGVVLQTWMSSLPNVIDQPANAAVLQDMASWLLDHALAQVFGPLAGHAYVAVGDVGMLSCVATMLRVMDALFCEHLPAYTAAATPSEHSRHASRGSATTQSKGFPGVTEKVGWDGTGD